MQDNEEIQEIKKGVGELKIITDNLFEHFEILDEKVDHVGERLTRMEKNQEKMMNNIDYIVGAIQDERQEKTATTHLFDRQGQQITNHESRIKKLESAAPVN